MNSKLKTKLFRTLIEHCPLANGGVRLAYESAAHEFGVLKYAYENSASSVVEIC